MKRANSTLIGGSVGKGGLNKKNDVRAVQTLLNLPANMNRYVALLGGNQGNSVCRRWFVGLKDCYQRWPG